MFCELFKIVVIGDAGVGKSTLLKQATGTGFSEIYDCTIGVEFYDKTIPLNDRDQNIVKLQLWDTAGHINFRAVTESYYGTTSAFILVFDLTRKETFERLPIWIKNIRRLSRSNVDIFLVGNKSDLTRRRDVSQDEINRFVAEQTQVTYFETTAQTRESGYSLLQAVAIQCDEIFLDLIALGNKGGAKHGEVAKKLSSHHTTLNKYIEENERRIMEGLGPFSKTQKGKAARFLRDMMAPAGMKQWTPNVFQDTPYIESFRDHILPALCEGRLANIFEDILYPAEGLSTIHTNPEIVALLQLEFAVGLLNNYMRMRCRIIETIRFAYYNDIIRAFKLSACAELKKTLLSGTPTLAHIKVVYRQALTPGDRLTDVVSHIEKLGCFGLAAELNEMQRSSNSALNLTY